MDERELRELVRAVVVGAMQGAEGDAAKGGAVESVAPVVRPDKARSPDEILLAKKTAAWLGIAPGPSPALATWSPSGDRHWYLGRTPARLGVGSAGVRYRTETLIHFLSDHAAAKDAVSSAVDPAVATALGFVPLKSAARDRAEFLRRPDLGRRLDDASRDLVQKRGVRGAQVQIVAVDGLSATALNVNLPRIVPVLTAELARAGVRMGTPFVVNMGRVVCADEVARLTGADVLCLLVGERPGLKTAESMGAYVTYMKVRQFNEAMRNVISNIHSGGLIPEDAARQVAETVQKALREKRTGVDANG
jgi:ethanolamine ammonia-lyase small subunit